MGLFNFWNKKSNGNKEQKDNTVFYDIEKMKKMGLPEDYCQLLSQKGLPKYIEPGLNFRSEEKNFDISVIEKYGYFYLGFEANGNYIVINLKNYAIVTVDMEDFCFDDNEEYEYDEAIKESILNTNLTCLYLCIDEYNLFLANGLDEDSEEVEVLYEKLKEIDSNILFDDYNETESSVWRKAIEDFV